MGADREYSTRQLIGLGLGPALFLFVRVGLYPPGLSPAANAVLASTLWIAVWWLTEAIPIPVTSLLPVVLFPALGVTDVSGATAPYADPVVFLFLGGFLVALAIERWGLHRRIALHVILRAGRDPRRLLLGIMVATAGLSMWISNTATAMLMVPIGMGVIAQREALRSGEEPVDLSGSTTAALGTQTLPTSNFGTGLMLGIAYAASVGGLATLIGTPPNAILAGVARTQLGVDIGFVQWLRFGLPLSVGFLGIAWALLVVLLPPESQDLTDSRAVIRAELHELGPMGTGERRTVAVFGLVVLGWLTRPFLLQPLVPGLTDTVVAVIGGILVFVVPVDLRRGEFLLDWQAATRVPWGVLLLFGAGFSIARAVQASGLDTWIATQFLALRGVAFVWILLSVIALIVFLSEFTSNSATASLFLPVVAGLALSLSAPPLVLMVAVAVAASFAFMLPVATPPNAIVFGSGYLSIPQMARVGFWLNLLGIGGLLLAVRFWLPIAWGL